jgi:hypothetical protein
VKRQLIPDALAIVPAGQVPGEATRVTAGNLPGRGALLYGWHRGLVCWANDALVKEISKDGKRTARNFGIASQFVQSEYASYQIY